MNEYIQTKINRTELLHDHEKVLSILPLILLNFSANTALLAQSIHADYDFAVAIKLNTNNYGMKKYKQVLLKTGQKLTWTNL